MAVGWHSTVFGWSPRPVGMAAWPEEAWEALRERVSRRFSALQPASVANPHKCAVLQQDSRRCRPKLINIFRTKNRDRIFTPRSGGDWFSLVAGRSWASSGSRSQLFSDHERTSRNASQASRAHAAICASLGNHPNTPLCLPMAI